MLPTLLTLTILSLNSPALANIATYTKDTLVTAANSDSTAVPTYTPASNREPHSESPYMQVRGEKGGLTLIRVDDELFILLHRTGEPTNTVTLPLSVPGGEQ